MRKALLVVLFAVAPLAGQEQATKVVQVKHRPADALAHLLVVSQTSVRPSRDFNTITLIGPQEQLKVAEAIIQQYDTPARQAEFTLRIIEGSMSAQGPNDAAETIPAELKSLLRYTRYALRDVAVLRGLEGDWRNLGLSGNMGGDLNFRVIDGQPPQIEVQVRIQGTPIVVKTEKGEVTHTPRVLGTNTTVRSGETVVLGASKMQGGPNALIVLLTAKLLP